LITSRGLAILFAGFAAALASIPLSNPYLAIAGAGVVAFAAASSLNFSRHSSALRFRSSRELSAPKAQAGETVECRNAVAAGAALPLKAEDTLPELAKLSGGSLSASGTGACTVSYSFTSPQRGLLNVGPTKAEVSDPSGAFAKEIVLGDAGEVLFYPSLSRCARTRRR
jgi:uncharacterized protein (DUF58 family)